MQQIYDFVLFFATAQSGYSEKSQITVPKLGKIAINIKMAITCITEATLIISQLLILQGAAAIAFGGVETGRQYEKEQDKHTGIIRYIGWILAFYKNKNKNRDNKK